MTEPSSIGLAAISVLNMACTSLKCALSLKMHKAWTAGELDHDFEEFVPLRPERPDKPELLLPKNMPRRRNIGEQQNMVALLHAIAHIEFNAIDLAWDMVARFGAGMPREFTDDWVSVAADETRHFTMLEQRLNFYEATYGALPAHDGLWQSAENTAHDIKARLAIVPLVLEARGLDVTPTMIARIKKTGDQQSVTALSQIYEEEINHVYAGQKWFNYICSHEKTAPIPTYQALVRRYFKGKLKPPFNQEARSRAGLSKEYYMPLARNLQQKNSN